jgi:hypothetical protein
MTSAPEESVNNAMGFRKAPRGLANLLADISLKETLVWSGAGISRAHPAGLPDGPQMTSQVLAAACQPRTECVVRRYFGEMSLVDSSDRPKHLPRLESVLEAVVQARGKSGLSLLAALERVKPNAWHELFAVHLAAEGAHITVNFDRLIERKLAGRVSGELMHLHGVAARGELDRLAGQISNLSAALRPFEARLRELLVAARALVFVGYSGSDFFDVDPFFAQLAEERVDLGHLQVIWLRHDPESTELTLRHEPSPASGDGAMILRSLARCRAKTFVCTGDGDLFRDYLAAIWGVELSQPPDEPNGPVQLAYDQAPTDRDRLLATARLFLLLNVGRETERLARELEAVANHESDPDLASELLVIADDCYRSHGTYEAAIRVLARAERLGKLPAWYCDYRRGALSRLRFDHLHAWRSFRRALSEVPLTGQDVPHECFDLLENYAGWWRNIWWANPLRFTSWFPPSLASAVRALTSDRAAAYVDSHPHIKPQLARIYHTIPTLQRQVPRPEWLKDVAIVGHYYPETDSLLGTVDYERNRIVRDKIRDPEALGLLLERSRSIGDLPGTVKAALLVRRVDASLSFPADELREVQWIRARKWGARLQWWLAVLCCLLRRAKPKQRDA